MTELKRPMQVFGIPTRLIRSGDNLVDVILEALSNQGLGIDDNDLVAIASKAVAVAQNRLVKLGSINPSKEARMLAEKHDFEPSFAEVVLQEAEKVYGGVTKTLLTLKNDVLVANAGVDRKNAPDGYVALWPMDPVESAEEFRKQILAKTRKHVGVLIVDSKITPLRMGTTGLAIGVAGFRPTKDCRVEKDLYGKRIYVTRHAWADDLASVAHLIMGETTAKTPAVLIRNAPVVFSEELHQNSMIIPAEQCLYMQLYPEMHS